MPKKIENIREKLLAETRKQIEERGYKETTVRSVAGALSLGLGTLYNYFESKDMLVASFMLEDWIEAMDDMKARLSDFDDKGEKIKVIYDGLREFSHAHRNIFDDPLAKKTFTFAFDERHPVLLSQISEMILPLVSDSDVENKSMLSDFISEAILTWSASGRDYEELLPIFNKLIKMTENVNKN